MSKFVKFQLILATVLISIAAFYGGYYLGKRGYLFELRQNPPRVEVINQYPDDQQVDFALFWEVWDEVSAKYLLRPVDPQEMMYGAIRGMVSSLGDPYTSYLPPELNESVNNSLNGTYQGIGAELAIRDGQLIIVAPLDGSPASKAGVRAGDKILEIEGTSTIGITLTEAVTKIRGESGTSISLKLQRNEESPFDLSIERGVINVESVSWEDKGEGTVYIRVSRFGGDTNKNWATTVSEINSQVEELDSLVIDLRGNPGGYLASAEYLAEEFFTGAPVVFEEDAVGNQIPYKAQRVGAFKDIPGIFVLIDGGSASASEILAAALRSNANAKLVGSQSFGKGTIQDVVDFEDGSAAHITVKKWLTPEKEWIHDVGIKPDFEIERTSEDINADIDKQLEKAIELANEI